MGVSERSVQRVVAYVTSGDRLLVFAHTRHPEAGIQVPAGMVESGESLEQAALREVWEETGLQGLEIVAYLGMREHHLPAAGRPGTERRHYYHLQLKGEAPERWTHWEQTPSDGSPGPIEFELYWVQYPQEVPELSGGQGELLCKLPPAA
jgi:8-oxo-dGTP pyrophosphatase MutT (NUDIX family)